MYDFFKLKIGFSPESLFEDQPDTFFSYPCMEEDVAVIIYTSGTTGKPKGACLSHLNLFLNAKIATELFQSKADETVLAVLPLFHIFGMTTMMNASVYKGMNIVLLPRFDAKTCFELIVKHDISIFAGVPTMYWALLNVAHDPLIEETVRNNLRLCVSGGAPLPVKIIQDFFESIYKVPILEGYGMSEGSPIVSFNQIDQIRKQGSIGTPVWGVEVKIVDENDQELPALTKGELIFKGHNVMKEYYRNPEATAQVLKDGWMHSGDIAYRDEQGVYFIVDRSKDMIIRGGMNVYPRELEEIMLKHEAVSMVAVIGIPDEKFGEEIAAFIVLKSGKEHTQMKL
ncbi:AMP-binding protein [Pedobacter sp. NJ-S-72]